jgi:prepilin-type N-terminal cleavage/methylation domain-containing protein
MTLHKTRLPNRAGFSLTELMAAVAIIGAAAAIIVVRSTAGASSSKSAACQSYKGEIEIQAELWRHNTGSWPATNLSNIGGDIGHFPAGIPTCPVSGSSYTIDSAGRVVGHDH